MADGSIHPERQLSRLGKAALAYAAFGWRVFPCEPAGKTPLDMCDECLAPLPPWNDAPKGEREKSCRSCGTVHEEKTKQRGCHLGTSDPAQIERWWRHVPDANIGVRMGLQSSGDHLLALDVDGEQGASTLADLIARHGELPPTPVQSTMRGRHYLFRAPAEACHNSASKDAIGPKIDTRGEGGYIIVSPSVRTDGNRYEWDPALKPSQTAPADAPAWLVDALIRKPDAPRPVARPTVENGDFSKWADGALTRAYEAVANCPQGQRNNTLFSQAAGLFEIVAAGALPAGTVRQQMEAAALAAGLRKSEIQTTINSAQATGMAKPRDLSHVGARQASAGRSGGGTTVRLAASGGVHVEPDATPAYGTRPSAWINGEAPEFVTNADGMKLKSSIQNVILHLRHETQLAGLFSLDEMSRHTFITRDAPWGGPQAPRLYSDADITALCAYLETHMLSARFDTVKRAIGLVARENMTNPIRERLLSIEWDDVERLDRWAIEYLGCADTPFTRQAGAKWLIGACARIMRPGCKVDTMLVLEGPQGARKSSTLAALAAALAPNCYTDRLSNLDSKDAVMELQGNVIVEIAELDAFRGSQVSTIKAFLSRMHDKIRLPWDATITELPRACVFAGTVNPGGAGWLHDPTGARRFWPLEVGAINYEGIQTDAPQLWAEAMRRYNDGSEWWITDPDVLELAAAAAEERYDDDPWASAIDEYITGRVQATSSEVLWSACGVPKDKHDRAMQARVSAHLKRRGFRRGTIWQNGRAVRGFKAPAPWQPVMSE